MGVRGAVAYANQSPQRELPPRVNTLLAVLYFSLFLYTFLANLRHVYYKNVFSIVSKLKESLYCLFRDYILIHLFKA